LPSIWVERIRSENKDLQNSCNRHVAFYVWVTSVNTQRGIVKMTKLSTKLTAIAVATLAFVSSAHAHLTAVGWKDNGNGSVSMWGQHWHGDQTEPSTANGGIHIGVFGTDSSTWTAFQWTRFENNIGGTTAGLDAMVASSKLTGYEVDAGNFSNNAGENDWFSTDPLVIGNGTWGFITGPNCCIDTMSAPERFTITGVTSVEVGTGPSTVSGVPEPETYAMMLAGLGFMGAIARRRKAK
jgi:hypothetical protein